MLAARLGVAGAAVVLGVQGCSPLAGLVGGGGGVPTPSAQPWVAVRVLDGDTLDVTDAHGVRQRVRLLGIDAPEEAHDGSPAACGAQAATARLRELVPVGASVAIEYDVGGDRTDRYDRQLAYLAAGGRDVGETLLQEGLVEAWHPSSAAVPSRDLRYRAVQAEAQLHRRGSWATCSRIGR